MPARFRSVPAFTHPQRGAKNSVKPLRPLEALIRYQLDVLAQTNGHDLTKLVRLRLQHTLWKGRRDMAFLLSDPPAPGFHGKERCDERMDMWRLESTPDGFEDKGILRTSSPFVENADGTLDFQPALRESILHTMKFSVLRHCHVH